MTPVTHAALAGSSSTCLLRRVQPVGPALGNRRADPGERVYRVGHQRGDFAGDRGLAVVEHHAHAEIPQPGVRGGARVQE